MRIAVCSGSFDPITLGHLDVIARTAGCFDQVYVCVSPNAEKKNQMFTPEEKLELVRSAVKHLPNVKAELYSGLLADYVVERGANVIVRGVRNGTDFDSEVQMAHINQGLHPEIETLLLPASPRFQHFSSSMVREMIRYHQNLEDYLPPAVVSAVHELLSRRKEA